MDDDLQLMLLSRGQALRTLLLLRRMKRRRRYWVHPIFGARRIEGEYETLMPRLRRDPAKFTAYFRMDMAAFDLLLSLVRGRLEKTSIRKAITSEQRLALTLRFLASGTPYRSLAFSYRVSHNAISAIVREVCTAIFEQLSDTYLRQPTTAAEWLEVADGFWKRWNLPNTVGAIDGKHVMIKKPPKSASLYFNYKGHFSMVLLAICDSRYRIIHADFGHYGSDSDARIFGRSDFRKAMDDDELDLPPDEPLPGSGRILPYFFVADNAFPLGRHLMKPFPGKGLSHEERVYNYRISRGRRVIENVFGIMAAKWRILNKPIETRDDNADLIIKAICVLHNFVIDESGASAMADTGPGLEENGSWRQSTNPMSSAAVRTTRGNRSGREENVIRRELVEFFSDEGAVEWQLEYI